MAQPDMQVQLHFRWRFRAYLQTLGFLCGLTGREPNWDRVYYWLERGVVVKVNGQRYRPRRFPSRSW